LISRLFGYRNTLSLAGDGLNDVGSDPRTAMKAINRWGICREDLWPYDVDHWKRWPGSGDRAIQAAYDYARTTRWEYAWITSTGAQRVTDVKLALDAGFQVGDGGAIGDEYGAWKPGDRPLEPPTIVTGHHARVIEGYTGDVFRELGSWGTSLGDDGRVEISADYVASPAMSSLLIIRKAPVLV